MKRYVGPILIILGVLWLCADYAWNLSRLHLNILLIAPFVLIILGVIIHVLILKKESKY